MKNLSASQAFWLGHLYQASELNLPLAVYAKQQTLSLAEFLLWRRRLKTAGIALPVIAGSLFVAVEVVA